MRELDKQVRAFDPAWLRMDDGLERFDRLSKLLDRETRAVLACARALRLTPQSRIRPDAAGSRAARRLPKQLPWAG
jgi:hypothetical protein